MNEAAVIPYTLNKGGGDNFWTAHCKFCLFYAESPSAQQAGAEVTHHARHPEQGDHYDPISGLYFSPEDLEQEREMRRRDRAILGDFEDKQNINQAGL